MTMTTTTSGAVACVYEGCEARARDVDCDGDAACARHAAQSERWVVLVSSVGRDGDWLDTDEPAAIADAMEADGWDVEIRTPRGGECEGTYVKGARGDLHSVASDDRRAELLDRACAGALTRVREEA
jgi:hypothetical protein